MDDRKVEMAPSDPSEMYIRPSCRMTVLAKRKRVSRSPSQSSSPEAEKSSVSPSGDCRVDLLAGVEAALRRRTAAGQPTQASRSKPSSSRASAAAAPVAQQCDQHKNRDPAEPRHRNGRPGQAADARARPRDSVDRAQDPTQEERRSRSRSPSARRPLGA